MSQEGLRKTLFLAWLVGVGLLIGSMVVLGGLTRLTQSGLSMVEWRPLTGFLPPLTSQAWQEVFQAYQRFPEYQQIHSWMSLSDFKSIYWMEYTHRLLGRVIGIWFLGPFIYFYRFLSSRLRRRCFGIFMIGGVQGLVGWWMVQSGLDQDPMVSPYRLALHLFLAFGLGVLVLWTFLEQQATPKSLPPSLRRQVGAWLLGALGLILLTLFYGALVAGLKAGLIYNTFPFMGGVFLPEEWASYHPWVLNFFENPVLVQWIHRWMGVTTFLYVWVLVVRWRSLEKFQGLPRQLYHAALLWAGSISLQVGLGVMTLLWGVPVGLGVLHQANALGVLGIGVWILYHTRGIKAENLY